MLFRRKPDTEHPPFAALPVQKIVVGAGTDTLAVHVSGQLSERRLPVICVAGYQRNMVDYTDFARLLQRELGADWPVALVDLRGRGRSASRRKPVDYVSPNDATDLGRTCDALGIARGVFVGQGYGGQVLMLLATQRPTLLAGTVLVDAGPVTDPRGLVRLRSNLSYIGNVRGESSARATFRQILGKDYPGVGEDRLIELAQRSHLIDRRGRTKPLYDRRLETALASFNVDDVLTAQWSLFAALAPSALMLVRTQLSDQVRRDTFEEMGRRRRDATSLVIAGQGSPALFDRPQEVEPIARFVSATSKREYSQATSAR